MEIVSLTRQLLMQQVSPLYDIDVSPKDSGGIGVTTEVARTT